MRQLAEYVALRVMLGAIDALPLGGAAWFARRLGDLWWRVLDPRRRKVAIANIMKTRIETDPERARSLGRRSFQHFGLVVIESLKSARLLDDGRWREHLTPAIAPEVMTVLEDPTQGLIMVSGHFGSWEIAAHWLSRYKPVAGITRPMNNPRVENLLQRRKPRYDFHPIPKYTASPGRLIEALDNGELLALLTDQRPSEGGVEVPFFGFAAVTYSTAAMLHLLTGAPLCFAACRRVGPYRFELSTSELIQHPKSGDKRRDVQEILGRINGFLEDEIRLRPEQYNWGHERWRQGWRNPGPSKRLVMRNQRSEKQNLR